MEARINLMMIYDTPVILLGGAPIQENVLHLLLRFNLPIIAADSGADHCLYDEALDPDRVIGDFDSISAQARAQFAGRLSHDTFQDTNDFQKCLNAVSAPLILAFGFLGGRFDHHIATLSIAKAEVHRHKIIFFGDGDVSFLLQNKMTFALQTGAHIGVLPWPDATLSTRGLYWELDDLPLVLGGQISSSNKASQSEVVFEPLLGFSFVTIEIEFIDAILNAFGFPSLLKTI